MHECIEKFNVILEKDLKEMLEKVTKAGTVNPDDVKVIDKAVDLMLKLQEYDDWQQSGNEGNSYDGYSTRRGRSMTTGRYVSRDRARDWRDEMPRDGDYSARSYGRDPYMRGSYDRGYSGHSMKDRLIADLESKYDQAQSEHERQFLDTWIKRIEMEK